MNAEIIINSLADEIKRLTIENAMLKAQLNELIQKQTDNDEVEDGNEQQD